MFRGLTALFELACRVWDWFFSPRRVEQRQKNEVNQAIATHDEKKVNEILDDKLR